MRARRQFAGWLLALGISALGAWPLAAQEQDDVRPKAKRAPAEQEKQARQPRRERPQQKPQPSSSNTSGNAPGNASGGAPGNAPGNAYAPGNAANNESGNASKRERERAAAQRPQEERNYPPSTNPNRPPSANQRANQRSNESEDAGAERPGRMNREERQRVLENQQRFRQLSPQQQEIMRERADVWQRMTPEQRSHVKDDVLPNWRQLPPERQRAIEQRLGVLKNMPESARNRHLSDPNFTRGMSEQDKALLKDLSHLHVGGEPDPPEQKPPDD